MELSLLYALQEVEAKQQAIEEEKRHSPVLYRLHRIKQDFEEKKQIYQDLIASMAQLEKDLAAFPIRISQAEQKLQDEQKAIYSGTVTSAKELSAREAQVASWEQKISELSALHLAYLGEQEQKKDQASTLKKEMEQLYQDFRQAKTSALQQDAQWAKQLEEMSIQKQTLLKQISDADLMWFRKEQASKPGKRIARIGPDMVCSGCQTIATPALYKRAKHQALCCCENCGRILFVDE